MKTLRDFSQKYVLAPLLLVLAFFTLNPATAAFAADCKPSTVPDTAGSGVPGMLDGQVSEISGGNYYGEYGWGGLKWGTCDLPGGLGAFPATIDTWAGNAFLGLAKWLAAAMTGFQKWAADPAQLLGPLDKKITDMSKAVIEVVYDDWVLTAAVVAGVFIITYAMRKQVRLALMATGAFAAAVGFVALVGVYPVTIAQSMDGVATSITSVADQKTLEVAAIPTEGEGLTVYANSAEATGAVLNDGILHPLWRQGAVGSAELNEKVDTLFRAGAASWAEKAEGVDADKKKLTYDRASRAYKNDKSVSWQYNYIKGEAQNRAGMGFLATVLMVIVAIVRIPAIILVFLGVMVLRMLPILGPIFALLAIIPAMRSAGTAAIKVVMASVVNVIVYGVMAAVHTALTAILFMSGTNLIASALILLVLTVLFMKLAKPFKSVTSLATGKKIEQSLSESDPSGLGGKLMGGVGSFLLGQRMGKSGGGGADGTESLEFEESKPKRKLRPDTVPDDHTTAAPIYQALTGQGVQPEYVVVDIDQAEQPEARPANAASHSPAIEAQRVNSYDSEIVDAEVSGQVDIEDQDHDIADTVTAAQRYKLSGVPMPAALPAGDDMQQPASDSNSGNTFISVNEGDEITYGNSDGSYGASSDEIHQDWKHAPKISTSWMRPAGENIERGMRQIGRGGGSYETNGNGQTMFVPEGASGHHSRMRADKLVEPEIINGEVVTELFVAPAVHKTTEKKVVIEHASDTSESGI